MQKVVSSLDPNLVIIYCKISIFGLRTTEVEFHFKKTTLVALLSRR